MILIRKRALRDLQKSGSIFCVLLLKKRIKGGLIRKDKTMGYRHDCGFQKKWQHNTHAAWKDIDNNCTTSKNRLDYENWFYERTRMISSLAGGKGFLLYPQKKECTEDDEEGRQEKKKKKNCGIRWFLCPKSWHPQTSAAESLIANRERAAVGTRNPKIQNPATTRDTAIHDHHTQNIACF